MNYILLMTSAGSFLYAGYLLLERVMRDRMSQSCRYGMLVAVLFSYLVPWVWMKSIYGAVRLPLGKDNAIAVSGRLAMSDAVVYATDEVAVTPGYGFVLVVAYVWLIVAVLAMILRCGFYICSRRKLLKRAGDCGTELPEELVLRLKKEFRIKRRIRIVQAPDERRSFTLGHFRPVVFLQKSYGLEELELILRHEFTHISRGDMLVKMLMQLVCCLHWFNPLVYCLNRRLDRMCERACDERVIRNMPEDGREVYARLIIRSLRSGKPSKRKLLFISFFASNEKDAEERIREIMNKRKSKLWEKIVVAGIFGVLLFADSLTAMAYPDVYHVEEPSVEAAGFLTQGRGVLVQDYSAEEEADADFDDVILYKKQLVTADGEILPLMVTEDGEVLLLQGQTKVFCFWHKWEDAKVEIHDKHADDDGCTIYVYKCTYCPRCNTVRMGDLYATIIYTTCTHDNW